MNKIELFFYALKNAFYNFDYYKEFAKVRFWFVFKYLSTLLILVSLFTGIYYATQIFLFIPQVPEYVAEFKRISTNLYPEELEITITNGMVSTNVEEPFYIQIPEPYSEDFIIDGKQYYLAVIDTAANAENFIDYNSLFMLTEKSIVTFENYSQGTISIIPLSDIKETVLINKALYDQLISYLEPYYSYIEPALNILAVSLIFIVPFIIYIFWMPWALFYTLVLSLIGYALCKVTNKQYTFKEVYKIGLYTLTVPTIVTTVTNNFYIIPFLHSMIFIVLLLVALYKEPNKSTN